MRIVSMWCWDTVVVVVVASSYIAPHLSHLPWRMSQPNWRKLARRKHEHSAHGDLSVSRAENQSLLWCWPVLRVSGEAVRKIILSRSVWKTMVCWRIWSDLGLILKSFYQPQSCVALTWMQAIKWGHPSAFIRQTSKSFWPAAYLWGYCPFSCYGIENPLYSIVYYADLLHNVCSMSQGVHVTIVPYQSISHPLFQKP